MATVITESYSSSVSGKTNVTDFLRSKFYSIFVTAGQDEATMMAYMLHINQSRSHWKQCLFNIITNTYTTIVISGVVESFRSSTAITLGNYICLAFLLVAYLLVNILGWFVYYDLLRQRKAKTLKSVLEMLPTQKSLIKALYLFSLTAFTIIDFLGRIFIGQCYNSNRDLSRLCDPNQRIGGLPGNALVFLIIASIVPASILRETRISLILLNWILAMVSYVTGTVYAESYTLLLGCLAYVLIGALVIFDTMHLNFEMFASIRELKSALEENERMAATDRATEMRHMIANIAHDLKTVRLPTILKQQFLLVNLKSTFLLFLIAHSRSLVLWLELK